MNIIVMGAGAIGSLYGAYLSQNHNVVLIGRKDHVVSINHKGLHIDGITNLIVHPHAYETINDYAGPVDLVIVTVKSYDTDTAIQQIAPIITNKTLVLSLQNGLDNIVKISQIIDQSQIVVGITTQGATFTAPGRITHTGKGSTILGGLSKKDSSQLQTLATIFNEGGIHTTISTTIQEELWRKAIINSSINPLTALFQCSNGYLHHNPICTRIVDMICKESTTVAQKMYPTITQEEMMTQTHQVITNTATNKSSMLQSILQGKSTEIESITGIIVQTAQKYDVDVPLNSLLLSFFRT